MKNLATKEVRDLAPCWIPDGTEKRLKSLTEFIDHVEIDVRDFVRQILQGYLEEAFLRFIGAKPYERTSLRKVAFSCTFAR